MPGTSRSSLLVAMAVVAIVLAGCTPSSPAARTADHQYLAIGDSYTAGFRPAIDGEDATNTTDGFAWRVAEATGLSLVNVSCSGITTVDFVDGPPCQDDLRAPGGLRPVDGSEFATVLDHLDAQADHVELVTVALGANDLRTCSFDTDWRTCVEQVVPRVRRSLDTLLTALRDRLGRDVTIIGLSYPDVWLGAPVLTPDAPDAHRVADRSVEMFRSIVNPTLRDTYAAHGAIFVDVTRAFGAYLPPGRTMETAEFGTVAARSARICAETYYCALGDPHPNVKGHQSIADLVVRASRD